MTRKIKIKRAVRNQCWKNPSDFQTSPNRYLDSPYQKVESSDEYQNDSEASDESDDLDMYTHPHQFFLQLLEEENYDAIRHHVYNQLLNSFFEIDPETDFVTTDESHKDYLLERGFHEDVICENEFLLMPEDKSQLVKQLIDDGLENYLQYTPGFYQNRDGEWCLDAPAGMVFPVIDDTHQTVALKVCVLEGADQGKELYINRQSQSGFSPDEPIHVPKYHDEREQETIRLVQGALKAELVSMLQKYELTLGLHDIRDYQKVLPILNGFNAMNVRISFDTDYEVDRSAACTLVNAVEYFEPEFKVQVEVWDSQLGRRIDDLINRGGEPIVLSQKKKKKFIKNLIQKFGLKPVYHL